MAGMASWLFNRRASLAGGVKPRRRRRRPFVLPREIFCGRSSRPHSFVLFGGAESRETERVSDGRGQEFQISRDHNRPPPSPRRSVDRRNFIPTAFFPLSPVATKMREGRERASERKKEENEMHFAIGLTHSVLITEEGGTVSYLATVAFLPG